MKLIVFLDVFIAKMYKFLLADLNSSKILANAFLSGEVILDGGGELEQIGVIDAAAFWCIVLFKHFLFCLKHRLPLPLPALPHFFALFRGSAHVEIEIVGGADGSLLAVLRDKIGERGRSFFEELFIEGA